MTRMEVSTTGLGANPGKIMYYLGMLFVVLGDEDARSRRSYRALLLLRRDGQFGVQLFHKGQQIIDLGAGEGAKFKVSHSVWKQRLMHFLINVGIIYHSANLF